MIGTQESKVWTPETTEQLKQLWKEGLSAAQIANIIPGATRNAVIGKKHRLGLEARRQAPSLNPIRIRAKRERQIMLKLDEPVILPEPPKGTVPFMKSNATTCRSVEGYSPEDGLAMFCSNPKSLEASFCPYHQAIYYRQDVK